METFTCHWHLQMGVGRFKGRRAMWEAVRVELTHQQTQCTDAGTGKGSDSIQLQGFAPSPVHARPSTRYIPTIFVLSYLLLMNS